MKPAEPMRVGAIDLGSNSIRMLVADVFHSDSGRVVVIARAGEACRLARGLDRSGVIDADSAARAGAIARSFVERARGLGAVHLVFGATAALRNAANGEEVAKALGAESGVPVRVLTGEEEAKLMYRAVVLGLGRAARRSPCLVFDIGGGSTEVVSGLGDQPGRWVSLPFGAVSLTERYLASDPPSTDEIEALRREVREQLMHDCAYMPRRCPLLAGVGGTVTLLAALDMSMEVYDPAQLEGRAIDGARLKALVAGLAGSTHDQRRGWPVMGEGRADIVVAGALVVELLAERFPSAALTCSTQGLRYGLARLAAEEARAQGFRADLQPRPPAGPA